MSSLMRWSRVGFNAVAWLFAACCAIQVYLAGLGVFASGSSFITHRDFGYVFGLLTLALIVLAILGRVGRRVIIASILLLALFALQSVFIVLWKSNPPSPGLAALHPLNGFLIFAIAVAVAWMTRGYLRLVTQTQSA